MSNDLKERIKAPTPEEIKQETEWIALQIEEVGEESLNEIAQQAAKARPRAYAPYSGYHVGAAVLSKSGRIYDAANIERVSYTQTSHAEGNSIDRAINAEEIIDNGRRFIKALAVSHEGDSAPCGHCRQIMIENGDNFLVVMADVDGKIIGISSLRILLPYAFTPTHLGID